MNHLLSDSPWNYQDVLADLCIKTSEVLSGTGQEVGLLIDEVGFRKKGRHSACVGRQYLGCIGKHDNGQVAVVAGLSSGKYYCPIDVALFMPKSWQDDHIRRKKAKIPENIQHQSMDRLLSLRGYPHTIVQLHCLCLKVGRMTI
jgi:SRSO17 transposase